MGTLSKSLLLFGLNWLDAQLTIIWVRLNVASEGNALMAGLLNHSEISFLVFKIAIGAFAAYILYRCSHLPLARRGLSAALIVYSALMVVHAATACFALGWPAPVQALAYIGSLPGVVVSLFA